jgi:hypothetical protein
MQANPRFDHVYAVVRIDSFLGPETPLENKIAIKEILWTEEAARREVDRLNQLNEGKGCHDFWQTTRLEKVSVQPDLNITPGAKADRTT